MAQASSTIIRPKFAAEGQPYTVFIEGNIGSGKTTFLNYFKKFDEVCLQAEPVEKWRDVAGVNLLVSLLSRQWKKNNFRAFHSTLLFT